MNLFSNHILHLCNILFAFSYCRENISCGKDTKNENNSAVTRPVSVETKQQTLSRFIITVDCRYNSEYIYTGNPDILICGNCRELFNDIVDMLEHKRIYCKMRFTCKCDQGAATDTAASPASQAAVKAIEFSQPSPNKKGRY